MVTRGDDDGDNDGVEDVPTDIIEAAVAIVPGDVISVEAEEEFGQLIWELLILTESGSTVEVELWEDGSLMEIESKTTPFDYVVNPGEGFLSFSEAKAIALEEVNADLIEWELELDGDDLWVYEFVFADGEEEVKVEIDAETGEVL